MPSIVATEQPVEGRVLIQVNWTDYPDAQYARVLRVLADGTSTPVRPHTAADSSGNYIKLSGGQAILYDTEAPLDVTITYTTDALNITGTLIGTLVAQDTFTRVVAAGSWGTTDTGQVWQGASAELSVNGTTGLVGHAAANDTINNETLVPILTDCEIVGTIGTPVLATGASLVQTLRLRKAPGVNSYYHATVTWQTTGVVSTAIQRVPGFATLASGVADFSYAGATTAKIRFRIVGTTLLSRTWLASGPEPTDWHLTATDSTFASGAFGVRSQRSAGNTNPGTVTMTFDDISVFDLTVPAFASTDIILSSGNDLWLKSPLHPWADQRVVLDVPQEPDCVPESAIFFQSMTEEVRQSRTSVFGVNNRKNPIAAARTRGGIASTLALVSRRFTDRDNLIILNEPGDPLFFQGPADYGIPDRYMTVGDYAVARLSPDHRHEWRLHALPHVEVDRPAGLADGVLGNRWLDICDVYATFADAEAAGLTWTLVLLGEAALVPTPSLGLRFYSDIPVDFATYGDIPTGGRTYEDLLEDR